MSYEVFIYQNALKELKKLPKKDKEQIKEVLKRLTDFPSAMDTKKLRGLHNKFRIRSGNYRIIVEIEDGRLMVISILPRKTAYRK